MKSNQPPLYELRIRTAERGCNLGYTKPVMHQTSLKYWNGEVMFLRGFDLDYMPQLATDQEIDDFHPPTLKDEALVQIQSFCECLDYQMTRDSFMKHKTMFYHGCKSFVYLLSLGYSS